MNSTTLIFPMAGKGTRFGGTFKPFLEVNSHGTFIELAFEPFKKWLPYVKEVLFVYLSEQEETYNVSENLRKSFPDVKFDICMLEKETSGPAETIRMAIQEKNIKGAAIICDCDHALDVDNIFKNVLEGYDAILPVWPLRGEDIKSWSIASVTNTGKVTGIAEKKLPDTTGEFFGVIGCVFIKDIEAFNLHDGNNVSDIVAHLEDVQAVKIDWAKFFGDPQRLKKTLAEESKGTIFCDLDGTVIVHEDSPSTMGIKVLEGATKKLREWYDEGYYIVLTTARNSLNREYLESHLLRNNIEYITIQSTGDSKDFGDLSQKSSTGQTGQSPTRGIVAGGWTPSPGTRLNNIQYITISTQGNTSDFGDIITASAFTCGNGASNAIRGLITNNNTSPGTYQNVIQ